jgi:hypothetical protein
MMPWGANVHAAWTEQSDPAVRAEIRDQLQRAGATTVRLDYAWATIQPNGPDDWRWDQLDTLIGEYAAAGMSVLLMLYWPPDWSSGGGGKPGVPGDPADFGRVCGEVGKRYGGQLAGVELWNEPDLSNFWTGTRAQFAQLLAGAYPVAKGVAPGTLFLAGAPTYLGLANGWFADMYASGLYGDGRTHDAQAIHPYPSPSDLPPNAPASDWSINGIPDLQALRGAHGDTSPLWVTEVGYSTHDSGDDVENWKRGVSEVEQAAYTLGTLILLDRYGVAACYLYVDRDMADTSDPHERNFGLLRTDNTPKPVLDLLENVANAEPRPPDPQPDDLESRIAALETHMVDVLESMHAAADYLRGAAAALD